MVRNNLAALVSPNKLTEILHLFEAQKQHLNLKLYGVSALVMSKIIEKNCFHFKEDGFSCHIKFLFEEFLYSCGCRVSFSLGNIQHFLFAHMVSTKT